MNYKSLTEIQARKDELKTGIQQESDHITDLWHGLTASQQSGSKGELIAGLVSNSITAIDAFLLVRKLLRGYRHIFRR